MRKLILTILLCTTKVLVGESKLDLLFLEHPMSENLPAGSIIGTFYVAGERFTSASGATSARFHSLAIKEDGSLWSWGGNGYGQLGDGTITVSSIPKKIIDSNVVQVASGYEHSLAIMQDGSLWSWGRNGRGQLGYGTKIDSSIPKKIIDSDVVQIAGCHHSLAIKKDGSLWSWGDNYFGQLGDGNDGPRTNRSTPMKIIDSDVVQIAAGEYHSLAIKQGGSLWSWGYNDAGGLGNGSTTNRPTPLKIIDTDVSQITAGFKHSLAIKDNGSLWSWGGNSYGQLGDGTTIDSSIPKKIIDSNVVQVAAGYQHSLAIMKDGSLWSWGWNNSGQLGDGTIIDRTTPKKIIDSGVVQIIAGSHHSLAIKDNGSLWSWGYNDIRLGTGTTIDSSIPQIIKQMTISSITLAESDGSNDNHLCEIDGNDLKLLQPLSLKDTNALTIHVRAEIESEQVEQAFEISLFELLGRNFLGWLNFSEFPWVYSANSNSWYYLITEGNSLHTFDQLNGSWNQLLNVRLPITPAILDGGTKAEEDVLADPEQFGLSNDTQLADRKSESYNEGFAAGVDFDEFAPESPVGQKIKFVYDTGLISEVTFNNDGLNGSYTSRNDSGSILYVYQKLTKNTASLTLNTAHEIIVGTLTFDSPTTGRLTGTSNDTSGNPIGSGSAEGKFWILP